MLHKPFTRSLRDKRLSRSEMSWRNRLTQAVFWCRLPQCWDNLLRRGYILQIDTPTLAAGIIQP